MKCLSAPAWWLPVPVSLYRRLRGILSACIWYLYAFRYVRRLWQRPMSESIFSSSCFDAAQAQFEFGWTASCWHVLFYARRHEAALPRRSPIRSSSVRRNAQGPASVQTCHCTNRIDGWPTFVLPFPTLSYLFLPFPRTFSNVLLLFPTSSPTFSTSSTF